MATEPTNLRGKSLRLSFIAVMEAVNIRAQRQQQHENRSLHGSLSRPIHHTSSGVQTGTTYSTTGAHDLQPRTLKAVYEVY